MRNLNKAILAVITISILFLFLTGCPLTFTYRVSFSSNPSGMEITINGVPHTLTSQVDRYFNENEYVMLNTGDNYGWSFTRWEINGISYFSPSKGFYVTSNTTVKGYFEQSAPAVISGQVTPYTGSVISSVAGQVDEDILDGNFRTGEYPQGEYVPGEFIVMVDPSYSIDSVRNESIQAVSADPVAKTSYASDDGSVQFFVIEAKDSHYDDLYNIPGVISVERNYIFRPMEEPQVIIVPLPNDTHYGLQWGMDMMNLPLAWDQITTGSQTVVVAVLDTGVRFDHPDLLNVFYGTGWDFVSGDNNPTDNGKPSNPGDFSHGTHVSGTIAALTNNSKGVAGVAWGGSDGVMILPVRVLDSATGTGTAAWIAAGIVYAVDHGARIINLSLGAASDSTAIRNAIDYAYDNGVVVVAASGNDNSAVFYPAKYAKTIAVGAVGPSQVRASYSNYGPELDVVAPGGEHNKLGNGWNDTILSTGWSISDGNVYAFMQGTSMATPHVSGLVALLMSRGVTGVENIRSIIRSSAKDLGNPGFDIEYGYGLVDAYQALMLAGVGSPMIVFTYDTQYGVVDDIATADEYGYFTLNQVHGRQVELYMWKDSDGDGDYSVGDLLGYHGYTGGDPLYGFPQSFSTIAGGSYTRNFKFAPIVDTFYRPEVPKLSQEDQYRIRAFVEALADKR